MTEGFLSGEMLLFLATRTSAKLNSDQRCTAQWLVDDVSPRLRKVMMLRGELPATNSRAVRCTRPIWGDGVIDGVAHHLCSRCWHFDQLFQGGYRLLRANAAAEGITDTSLERLYVNRKLDGSPRDTVFDPVEWEQREDWDDFEEAA